MLSPDQNDSLHLTAYVDGACRGNPGPASCAAILVHDGAVVRKAGKFLGNATNNVAEYSGLLLALKKAAEFGNCRRLTVYTDSQLMARQISGAYKVKDPQLKRLKAEADTLIERFDTFEIHDIPRGDNSLADNFANETLDLGLEKQRGP